MGKAIEGAALIGGVIAAEALTAAFNPALVVNPAFQKAMFAVGMMGVSMEAGAVAQALTSNRGINITTRQTAAARQIIYGQQRVGGVEIYRSTTGSKHNQFNYVIVLAGHECDSIENLYLDGRQVFWQVGSVGNTTRNGVNFGGSAANGTHTGPNGVQYNFNGLVYCEAKYGDQLPGDVIGGLTANDPHWAASAGGSPYVGGCTYVYLKCEYNTNIFPGEPEIRFTVNGKNNVYDPRTNSTGFTSNWALICADVISDPVFGLGDNTVNQAQLIAAANVCDEQVAVGAVGVGTEARYTTNYHYDCTTSPGDALSAMLPGAAGRLSRIGGEWFIWPAYWQGPSFTFDQNALTGPIQWTPYRSYSELFNRVNGTYVAPNYPYNVAGNLYDSNGFYNGGIQNNFPFAFQQTNFPQYAADVLHGYASDQYLNEDGGVQLPKELGLMTVLSVSQAQRVAKINLLRNRHQGSGSFPMSLDAWRMQPLDVMHFTFAENGWEEKVLEIVGAGFDVGDAGDGMQSVRATMLVQETEASVYEWSVTEELTVYDVPATPNQTPYTPAPPTNMTLTSGASTALITLDGVIHPRIEVQWDTPQDVLTKQIQVQYSTSADPSLWIDAGLTDVANNLTFINNVVAGQTYNVRIRSLRANGAVSDWEEIDGYTVSITLSVIGLIAIAPAGTLVGQAYSDGTAGIIVKPFTAQVGNASIACLPSGSVTLTGLNQAQLYYVYYVDMTFSGGAITPIPTQNSADFLNKPGYFMIGSIVTPSYSSGGGGGGGGGSARYSPAGYTDFGSQTTANPAGAFDGDVTSFAIVSGQFNPAGSSTDGACQWGGFPSVVLTANATLYVKAAIVITIPQPGDFIPGSLQANIGGTPTELAGDSVSGLVTDTYSLTIPSGTNIASVTVTATASGSGGGGSDSSEAAVLLYEIWIQT